MAVENYMRLAVLQAEKAMEKGEVPVGAVIVKGDRIISAAHNMREASNVVTAHAEILALEVACKYLGSWRLDGCDMFVTMEPCPMCAGAIIQARIRNVYFGCYEKKSGAFGSITDLSTLSWTHKPNVYGGILEDECSVLPKKFFSDKR